MVAGMTTGERLAAVETWAENHEKVCAARWQLLTTMMVIGLTAILSVSGWGLTKVFDAQEKQLEQLRVIRAETAASAKP